MIKRELPSKVCVVCGLPFSWRKRWARCWDAVRYCSERCRRAAKRREPQASETSCKVSH